MTNRVGRWWPAWHGPGRDDTTLADLLAHASGLAAHRRSTRAGAARWPSPTSSAACRSTRRRAAPRSTAISASSCSACILERIGGAGLAAQVAADAGARLPTAPLAYRPPAAWRARTASTGWDGVRGTRKLIGEVNDANAWAMDGVAAHAGLFGTAARGRRVGEPCSARSAARRSMAGAARPRSAASRAPRPIVPGTSRALGWDTMKPTSSCGRFMSATAIGHTGFTGTSLWIDDARDLYVVLLTNRVATGATADAIRALRRAVHDAVFGPAT